MSRQPLIAISAACLLVSFAAWADPGKDESGHGRGKREYKEEFRDGNCKVERKWEKDGEYKEERKCKDGGRAVAAHPSYFHQHGYTRVPNGHLPPPGECRIWYPDRPAGHQPPPFKCGAGHGRVEPGGWLITPGPQPREVEVSVYDPRRPGIVVDVGIFDARTGSMIRIVGAK
ncbi:hypothetical protein [Methylibium rhizosphaerae]|uniref:hypothetical protein n=1 Tax=Methylibium rhizosphaerae TaxID=2570323 RepID=UPI003CCC6A34